MILMVFWALVRRSFLAYSLSNFCSMSMRQFLVVGSFQVPSIVALALFSSADVNPATHCMRWGMTSASKGMASKVISGNNQIFCLRMMSACQDQFSRSEADVNGDARVMSAHVGCDE